MSNRFRFLTVLSVFAALFLIYLIIFIVDADDKKHRVIFFPEDDSDNLIGEVRKLKSRGSLEKDIESLLKEILLGPELLENSRYIPQGTRLNSLILRDRVLYADYSDGIISADLLFKSPEKLEIEQAEDENTESEEETAEVKEPGRQAEAKILSVSEIFSIIRQTIDFNFPSVKQIVFTIDGEIPNFGKPLSGDES